MPSRRRPLLALAAAVLLATSLVACGGGKDASGTNGDSSTVKPGMDPEANFSTGQRYFEAVASNDPDVQVDGLEFAAPDSPAAVYLTYLADSSAAFNGAGQERGADTLTPSAAGYGLCFAGSKDCVDYSAVTLADGKVNNFTVSGTKIDKRTAVGKGNVAPLGKLGSMEFLSRNLSATSNAYVVNVRVASADGPITLASTTALFKQADGTKFRPVRVVGPKQLEAGSAANVLLVFAGVTPGPGELYFGVTAADGTKAAIALKTF